MRRRFNWQISLGPERLRLVWFGFMASTVLGYLMPNPFLFIWTILFKTILFSTRTQFSSIWPIHRTLSGATTLGQSGLGSDGNKGVLRILQSHSITDASPSDCLMTYQDTRWRSLTRPERCSWYILQPQPTGPQDTRWRILTPLERCSWYILLPQPTGPRRD